MAKPGRPLGPAAKRRRNALNIYLTDEEHRALRWAAREAGQRPAEYARRQVVVCAEADRARAAEEAAR